MPQRHFCDVILPQFRQTRVNTLTVQLPEENNLPKTSKHQFL